MIYIYKYFSVNCFNTYLLKFAITISNSTNSYLIYYFFLITSTNANFVSIVALTKKIKIYAVLYFNIYMESITFSNKYIIFYSY